MQHWVDRGLYAEFEQRLDRLLAELCPGWSPPELPERYWSNELFRVYHRITAKRAQVGNRLTAHPGRAAALARHVLDTIACDEDVSFNKQLIHPMLDTIGRRPVQRHLISVVESGPPHKKVCAVRAWYWSQVTLVYESVEAFRQGRPTRASRAADDKVADLRGFYRTACLTAFVACDHAPTREWLAHGFILRPEFYPPTLEHLVVQARAIAEADPTRYKNLLAKTGDGTSRLSVSQG